MRLTPIAWRYAFPGAKGTSEGVWVFKAEQVCGLIQLQHRVGEVISRHLMPGFVEDSLKTGTGFLQAALHRARAQVERLRDQVNGGALSGEPVLNGSMHEFDETVLILYTAATVLQTVGQADRAVRHCG